MTLINTYLDDSRSSKETFDINYGHFKNTQESRQNHLGIFVFRYWTISKLDKIFAFVCIFLLVSIWPGHM